MNALARQTDGRILLAGAFSLFANSPRRLIARIHENGSIDPDFVLDPSVTAVGSITCLGLQADGKILIGGPFVLTLGNAKRRVVARLQPNGNLDPSFDAHLDTTSSIIGLAAEPENKVLMAGDFQIASNSIGRVVRLLENGTLDPASGSTPGPSGAVMALVQQRDNRVVIGGTFRRYNGITCNGLARLLGDVYAFDPAAAEGHVSLSVATIAGKTYRLESRDSLNDPDWTPRASLLGDGTVKLLSDPAPTPLQRFYRIRME